MVHLSFHRFGLRAAEVPTSGDGARRGTLSQGTTLRSAWRGDGSCRHGGTSLDQDVACTLDMAAADLRCLLR